MTRLPVTALILALLVSACATVETSTRAVPFAFAPLYGGAEGADLGRAYGATIPAPETLDRP